MPQESVVSLDDYIAMRCFAFTFRGDGAVILQCQMDNAAFAGCHGFQLHRFAGALYLGCQSSCQGFQGILAAFPVVFHVKKDEVVMVEGFACCQVGEVLERIQGLAMLSDKDTQAFAVEVQKNPFFVHQAFHGHI